jgi:hypothetical protein
VLEVELHTDGGNPIFNDHRSAAAPPRPRRAQPLRDPALAGDDEG